MADEPIVLVPPTSEPEVEPAAGDAPLLDLSRKPEPTQSSKPFRFQIPSSPQQETWDKSAEEEKRPESAATAQQGDEERGEESAAAASSDAFAAAVDSPRPGLNLFGSPVPRGEPGSGSSGGMGSGGGGGRKLTLPAAKRGGAGAAHAPRLITASPRIHRSPKQQAFEQQPPRQSRMQPLQQAMRPAGPARGQQSSYPPQQQQQSMMVSATMQVRMQSAASWKVVRLAACCSRAVKPFFCVLSVLAGSDRSRRLRLFEGWQRQLPAQRAADTRAVRSKRQLLPIDTAHRASADDGRGARDHHGNARRSSCANEWRAAELRPPSDCSCVAFVTFARMIIRAGYDRAGTGRGSDADMRSPATADSRRLRRTAGSPPRLLLLCVDSPALQADVHRISSELMSGVFTALDQFKQKCIEKTEVRRTQLTSCSQRSRIRDGGLLILVLWLIRVVKRCTSSASPSQALRLLVCRKAWPRRRRRWIA